MRRIRSLLLVLGLLVSALLAIPAATVSAALPAGTSKYITVPQVRVADTHRPASVSGYKRIKANHIRVRVAGINGVPANATAVVVNVTVSGSPVAGSVTAIPTGSPVSGQADVVTDRPSETVANLITVKVGIVGSIDLFHPAGMKLTIDMVGAYVPVTGAVADGRLVLMHAPQVALKSRRVNAGSSSLVDLGAVGVPTGASAAVVAITMEKASKGFVTGYAYGKPRPNTTSVMIGVAGRAVGNQTIVPISSTNRKMRVYTSKSGTLTVTVIGWFTSAAAAPSIDGLFVPSTAHRRLSTKTSPSKLAPFGPLTLEFTSGIGLTVSAVAANIVSSGAWDAGRVLARPAGVPSSGAPVSIIGAPRVSVAAHALLRLSSRGVAIYSAQGSHLVVDVVGWYLGVSPKATLAPVKNRGVKPAPVQWVKWTALDKASGRIVTKIARVLIPRSNDLNAAADAGGGAAYPARSMLGVRGNVMVFGHRSSHTAVFYGLHTISIGGTFSLSSDSKHQHWYTYRVVGRHITAPSYAAISAMAGLWPPVTAQLVACSKTNFLPTSTANRIVITGELIAVS